MKDKKDFVKTNKVAIIAIAIGLIIAIAGVVVGLNSSKKVYLSKDDAKTIDLNQKKGSLKSLLFGKADFELSYSQLAPDAVEIISSFEPGEPWQGGAFYDRRILIQGDASLGLTSTNREPSSVYLNKTLDLSKATDIEFYVNLSDNQALESAMLKLGDANLENYYVYTLNNLTSDWNFIRVPLNQFVLGEKKTEDFDWSKIEKIQFELTSRPNNTIIANLDNMRLLRDDKYFNDWYVNSENFLGLDKTGEEIGLLARAYKCYQATLSAISGASNFDFKAEIIPKRAGRAGLFFRGDYRNGKGYYFMIGGADTNSWSLMKNGSEGWETLANGTISNFVFEVDKKYWLLVKAHDNQIIGSLSLDDKDYTELFSVVDDEFQDGGVGVSVMDSNTYALFNNFYLKR